MTRPAQFFSLAFLLLWGSAEAQNRTPDLALKLYADQSLDFRDPMVRTGFDSILPGGRHFTYSLASSMGLAFAKSRSGGEFILHHVSGRKYTTRESVTDTLGNVYEVDIHNKYRQFSYSLEYTRNLSPERWEKLTLLMAAGLRHDMSRTYSDNFPSRGVLTTNSHRIALYAAPKLQYRMTDRFFMEAALPMTLFSHNYVKSKRVEKGNPATYNAASRTQGNIGISMVTLRLGIGYRF